MKKLITLHLLVLTGLWNCPAQNLVVNGDFESNSGCPGSFGELTTATGWYNYALLTPDYFNACNSSVVGVPDNGRGRQPAHSGSAYAGIFCSQQNATNDVREYITNVLSAPLQSGVSYLVAFYVNRSDISQNALSSIGAYLCTGTSLPMINWLCTALPQVQNTVLLPDTSGWTVVSGLFTASGGEQYITIGNFNTDQNSGLQNMGVATYNDAYYYIDDVSVSVATSVSEIDFQNVQAYPLPFNEQLKFSCANSSYATLKIFDATAKFLEIVNFNNSVSINTSSYPCGFYFYELIQNNDVITGKIIK